MNRLFFKIWFRKQLKGKVYSLANVLGLTLGFTAFILIALFIRFEQNWDKQNANYDRIYRVQRHLVNTRANAGNDISPHTRAATAGMIENGIPELEKVTVIREDESFLYADQDHKVNGEKGIYADDNFFDVFTYQFIHGSKERALKEPFSILLSQSMAIRLFGKDDVLGKTVRLEKKHPLTVVGVYADLPFNSSVRPLYIIPFSTLKPLEGITRSSMNAGGFMTYALLQKGAAPQKVGDKIRDTFDYDPQYGNEKLELCPLANVYLDFNGQSDYPTVLKLFGMIGLFILLMSGFNFINLSLANAAMRGKEVAVKKVVGGTKQTLVLQFLMETVAVSVMALAISFVAAGLLLPIFSDIVDKPLELALLMNWGFIIFMVLVAVVTGILSGLYPALILSAHKITNLFRGNFLNGKRDSVSLKKTLVTLQFAISLFLIILTLSFAMQIRYLSNKDLGFEKRGLLYAKISLSEKSVSFDQLRSRMLGHSEIQNMALSRNLPFVRFGGGATNWEGQDHEEKILARFNEVSYDYLSLLDAQIVQGRNFSSDFSGDNGKACIINETAAKSFGWEDPIGKRLDDNRLTIVGVVKDYVYKDMHNPIDPAVLVLAPETLTGGDWIFTFRVDGDSPLGAREQIASELERTFPDDPYEIQEVNTAFLHENAYRIYQSVKDVLLFFTVLNVFLAAMGMFALVSYAVARRTKEIGVRKIIGSSVFEIFKLLNKEYYFLIAYALVIAYPSAWWVYGRLPSANKLPMPFWVLLLGLCLLLAIVLLSTTYQTLKAARSNPVNALRNE